MNTKSCRFCLAVNVKVFVLGNTEEKRFIEIMLKQSGYNEDISETHYICYECHALLDKSYKFIVRVVAAQMLLRDMVLSEEKITLRTLKGINRKKYGLGLETKVLSNIDIYTKSILEQTNDDVIIKAENESDTLQVNSDTSNKDVDKKKINKRKNSKHEDDPTFSPELLYAKKKEKKNTKSNKDTEKMPEGNPVKYNKRTVLQPSKFILSLANVPDKRERHKTTFLFLDNESEPNEKGPTIQEPDNEFQPVSSDESSSDSSNSSCYSYDDDNGRRVKKSIKRVYPRQCDDCNFEIIEKKEHYRHYMLFHKNTPFPYSKQCTTNYVCQFCGKISKKKSMHDAHESTHAKHKRHQCWECPQKFYNRIRLLSHMKRTHCKIKLECDYCSKKFKTREDLRRHIRTHTGEKPFKCHICNAGFAHKGNVGIHIRANHEQEPKKQKAKKPKTKPRCERKYSSDDDDSILNLFQLKSKLSSVPT